MPRQLSLLNEEAKPYFKRTREAFAGYEITDAVSDDQAAVDRAWAAATPGIKLLEALYEDSRKTGPFLAGQIRAYPDLLVLGYLQYIKRCGSDIFARFIEIAPRLQALWSASQDLTEQVSSPAVID